MTYPEIILALVLAFALGVHVGARVIYKRAIKRLTIKNAEIAALKAVTNAPPQTEALEVQVQV